MKQLLLVVICIFSIGCSSILANYNRTIPPSGKDLVASIGEAFFVQEVGTESFIGYKKGYQNHLVYSGIDGQTITVSYQEFIREGARLFARPAFNLIFKYDLSKTKEFSFRGWRFKVISADSNKIQVKVLS